MTQPPTATEPTPSPAVRRTLADLETAKLAVAQDVAECLDTIGDLIRISGDPGAVFAWVLDTLGREHLKAFATRHRIKLHESRAADEEQLHKAVIIWAADGEGLGIIPAGQLPATTLAQLREEIAQRDETNQRAAAFQASVAAGHVEDVETWFARTSSKATG